MPKIVVYHPKKKPAAPKPKLPEGTPKIVKPAPLKRGPVGLTRYWQDKKPGFVG